MKSKLTAIGAAILGLLIGATLSGFLNDWIWKNSSFDAELEVWLNGSTGETARAGEGSVVMQTLMYRELIQGGHANSNARQALCEKLNFSHCEKVNPRSKGKQ